jgi:hypothetical protein
VSADEKMLPCDTCPHGVPLAARLSGIDARLDRIDRALFGDGNGKKGIVEHVEDLVDITRVGRSTFKVFMWIGGAVLAIATAAFQLKQTIAGFFH